MIKAYETPEEKIYNYINKNVLDDVDRRDFFYQLTLLDWNKTAEDYGGGFNDSIIQWIKREDIKDSEDISNIILLYNNPYGIYTLEFAEIIDGIYQKDKIDFIRGLNLVKDEAINIVYAFRLQKTFVDDSKREEDLKEIECYNKLSEDEKEIARMFFKMYETICHT